jgi:uncharacterized delta-60 repeat protein
VSTSYIARWDPLTATWSALGSGTNGIVYALAFDSSGYLYAGGFFTTAGGVSANNIARWDPLTSTWSALGSGVNDRVQALAFDGNGNLYVVGNFTFAGGMSANRVVRWDPFTFTWSRLGRGTNSLVYTLALDSSRNLYIGGAFAVAGGKVSSRIARWVSFNTAPVTANDNYTTMEDTLLTLAVPGVLDNDSDTDGDPLVAALDTAPAVGDLTFEPDGSFIYTPTLNYNGTVTFTYAAKDGFAWSNIALVTITVAPVNDAPLADDQSITTDEDTAYAGALSATDVEGDPLGFGMGAGTAHGSVEIASAGAFTYTPELNYNGPDVFTFTVTDGLLTDTGRVEIIVNPVNDPPLANDQAITTDEDTVYTGTLSAADVDGDLLDFGADTGPLHGLLAVAVDGAFTYTPTLNYYGSDVFTFTVTDGEFSVLGRVDITVNPVNDSPALAPIGDQSVDELALLSFTTSASDPDLSDTLAFSLDPGAPAGAAIDPSTGTFTWTPSEAQGPGVYNITVRVTDDGVPPRDDFETIQIAVGEVNLPPNAADDLYSTPEDTPLAVAAPGLLANDSDPDLPPNTLNAALGTPPALGDLALAADGAFVYTPPLNFNGTVTFTYVVSDGALAGAATASITVASVNDAPLANDDSGPGFITDEDTPFTLADVLANDTDPDGDSLFVNSFDASGTIGLVTFTSTAGELDASFDGDGLLTTDFFNNYDHSYALAVQPDGKLVVAGASSAGGGDFALARYNPDGSLDTSFDGDGRVTTDFNGNDDEASALALQPDGKIIVAGQIWDGNSSDFALARYNPDGSLDASFSGDGKVITDFAGGRDWAAALVVQPDGKIVASGWAWTVSYCDFAVARYDPDGSLDTSFDSDGKVTTDFVGREDCSYALALQPDGKLVVAGYAWNGNNEDFALARYNSDGSLDASFDGDGLLTTSFSGSYDAAYALALQPDGKLVAAGITSIIGNGDFALARYNPDGSLDTSFGGDGRVTTDFAGNSDTAYALACSQTVRSPPLGTPGTEATMTSLWRATTPMAASTPASLTMAGSPPTSSATLTLLTPWPCNQMAGSSPPGILGSATCGTSPWRATLLVAISSMTQTASSSGWQAAKWLPTPSPTSSPTAR